MTALDEMEVALQEHMMRIVENSLKSKSGRKIGQVANQFGEGGEEEEDVQQHWDGVLDQDCNEETEDRGARVSKEPNARRRHKRGQKRKC